MISPPPPTATAVETNGVHVDDFLPPPPTAAETNGAHVSYVLPPRLQFPPTAAETNRVHVNDIFSPRLSAVETNRVHVDDILPLPPAVRVEPNGMQRIFSPAFVYMNNNDNLRPQGEFPPTPTTEQCAEPTVFVPSSISRLYPRPLLLISEWSLQ